VGAPPVSHIGIAVFDLEDAVERYTLLLGGPPERIQEVPDQKVRVAIFSGSGDGDAPSGGRVELLTPISEDSPISGFLERRGEGLHHICIYVKDIEKKLVELREAGVRLIDETPRTGAEGNRIAFVHPKDMNGVLIELEERLA
jgi:methylmalonyl-CoA/ethylmalonyl-CoA epimerase